MSTNIAESKNVNKDDSFLNNIKHLLVIEITKITTIIEDNHASLTKQIDSVKNEINEKYDAKIGALEQAISKLENKTDDVGETALGSFDIVKILTIYYL